MSPDSIVSRTIDPSLSYFKLKQGKICTLRGEVQQVLDSNNRTNAGIGYSGYCYQFYLIIGFALF